MYNGLILNELIFYTLSVLISDTACVYIYMYMYNPYKQSSLGSSVNNVKGFCV